MVAVKVVTSLPFIVLMSVTVYMRGPTAPPSSSGGCQLTVAEKGPISLTVMVRGALGGTVTASERQWQEVRTIFDNYQQSLTNQ